MRRPPIIPPLPETPDNDLVDAVVAIGANLGDRESTITAAVARMEHLPLVESVRLSPLSETVALRPEGPDPEAPAYLNGVAIVRTRLAPQILLDMLHNIETEHGRERQERWGDRTLDLDLITYGDVCSDDERCTLPHPRAAERLFVLEPWLALDAHAELPGAGPVAELVDRLRAQQG